MSHKSGHIIINAMVPEEGTALPSLNPDQCDKLRDIRTRDEYTVQDRLYLGMVVATIADDPAD